MQKSSYVLNFAGKENYEYIKGRHIYVQNKSKNAADFFSIFLFSEISKIGDYNLFLVSNDNYSEIASAIFKVKGK